MMEENVYFKPGDVVQIKQDIPNKPLMLVVKKETSSLFKNEDKKNVLRGIRCRWFTATGELQETVWNTKDLILVQTN